MKNKIDKIMDQHNEYVERLFHPTIKYHYAIINKATWEVLAESDYYDYLEILLRELKTLHKGFMDTDNLFIGQRIVNKEVNNDK